MKALLVPVEPHDALTATLEATLLLAKRFDAYIEGFALRPPLSPFVAADAVGTTVVYDSDLRHAQEVAQEGERRFKAFMRAHSVPDAADGVVGLSAGWTEEAPPGDAFVGSYGRVFDATIVGRPDPSGAGPRMSTLEAALFDSGRPIIIAPPVAPTSIGDVIMIAWNRSTETARAVSFAKPLLRRASRVIVLTVEASNVPGPSGDQVARYLRHQGIACEARTAELGSRSAGEIFLHEAQKAGADLMVKGAFTQSRLRQMIFGGATRHIIAETTLPVLMAH